MREVLDSKRVERMARYGMALVVVAAGISCTSDTTVSPDDPSTSPTGSTATRFAPNPHCGVRVRANDVSPTRVGTILHGHIPGWLPDDMGLDSVFKGDDTGAAWFGRDCRLLLMLVVDLDKQIVSTWQSVGGSPGANERTYSRGFGDHSVTVQTKGIERSTVERILASIAP